jgi:hypothetical protein
MIPPVGRGRLLEQFAAAKAARARLDEAHEAQAAEHQVIGGWR